MKPTPREQYPSGDVAGETAFLAGLRQDLDLSCERLPPGLRARLRERRALALSPAPSLWQRPWLAPLGGALAMSVLMFALLPLGLPLPAGETGVEAALEDLDILAAGEELELLEEFEFYQWLAGNTAP